jgi:antitoxin FitA
VTSLTIRNLDTDTKQKFRELAARHGRSMEEEARSMIRAAVNNNPENELKRSENFYDSIRSLVDKHGGFDLEVPTRPKGSRPIPTFE